LFEDVLSAIPSSRDDDAMPGMTPFTGVVATW